MHRSPLLLLDNYQQTLACIHHERVHAWLYSDLPHPTLHTLSCRGDLRESERATLVCDLRGDYAVMDSAVACARPSRHNSLVSPANVSPCFSVCAKTRPPLGKRQNATPVFASGYSKLYRVLELVAFRHEFT